jgi:hypothetical protein
MRTLTLIPTPRHTNPVSAVTPRPWSRAARRQPAGQSPFGRVRRAAAELTPETIERIAQRVVHLLRQEPQATDGDATAPQDLMDAGQLAKHLGLTRTWVYEHANQLGAIQLGDGPRPRLRFDPTLAQEALRARRRRGESEPAKMPPRPGRPRRRPTSTSAPLLPIHEPRARSICARWHHADRKSH